MLAGGGEGRLGITEKGPFKPTIDQFQMLRLLRINNIEENKGQDKVMHGGVAYENQAAANSNNSIKSVTKT